MISLYIKISILKIYRFFYSCDSIYPFLLPSILLSPPDTLPPLRLERRFDNKKYIKSFTNKNRNIPH